MNDFIQRGRKALQRIHQRNDDQQWVFGTIGRLVDGVPVFDVTGRPGYIFVTIRQANGAQTAPPARNDPGVQKALGLPVRMRKEGTTYVIDSVAKRSDLAYLSPGQDPAIHTHDQRYFRQSEHIDSSAGAADAGKPAKLDSDGKWDPSLIDLGDFSSDDLPEGATNLYFTAAEETKLAGIEAGADQTDAANVAAALHAATPKATPDAADEWPYLNSVAAAWNAVKLTTTELITWLTTLFVDLTTAQDVGGAKTFTSTITQHSTSGLAHITAIGDGVRGVLSAKTFRNSGSQSLFQFTSARGTEAVPLTSVSGDRLAELTAYGYSQAAAAFVVAGTIQIRVDGTPDSGGDASDMPGRVEFLTTPDGSAAPLVALVVDSAQNVAVNTLKAPADVRFFVLQPSLGSIVQRLQSTATNDDPVQDIVQNRIATTDATVTTLHTFTVPASTTYAIEAIVTARRTGGAAGTAEDGARYKLDAVYKNVAAVATIIGALNVIADEDQAGWDATLTLSGATVLCQVTGALNNNVSWVMTARVWPLGT